jgi:uroporphyrinogen-III synthase
VTQALLLSTPGTARRLGARLPAAWRLVVVAAHLAPPPDRRRWARAVSELALFNWLLVPTRAAAEALLVEAGAPPSATLRLAAVGRAAEVFSREGRTPELASAVLREALLQLAPRLGRRERVLVPHAASAGHWLGSRLAELGAEPVCVPAYRYSEEESTEPIREADSSGAALAAFVGSPGEAEVLRAALDRAAPSSAADTPVAALDLDCADTAADCGFGRVQVVSGPLGPFLSEALS